MRTLCSLAVLAVVVGCSPLDEEPALAELTWDAELRVETLGFAPGPVLEGRTLGEVVSGAVDARGEGRSCTACHFQGTVTFYRPEVAQGQILPIGPYDVVDGRTWAGNNGWAAFFVQMGPNSFAEKPVELRNAFQIFLDQEAERVAPLSWDAVMSEENLGTVADPNVAGRTIADVLNSRVTGRPDGLLCSDCHYSGGTIPYRPNVVRGAPSTFGPNDVIDGRPWAGPDGWAERFVATGPGSSAPKPGYLRSVFFKWNDDGAY